MIASRPVVAHPASKRTPPATRSHVEASDRTVRLDINQFRVKDKVRSGVRTSKTRATTVPLQSEKLCHSNSYQGFFSAFSGGDPNRMIDGLFLSILVRSTRLSALRSSFWLSLLILISVLWII